MNSFRNHRLRDLTMPTSTAWLLSDIAEAKGKQELYTRQSPQILKALRDTAIIQSAESSNRIEGVTIDRDRCPGVSLDMVRQVLKNLRGKKVECLGRGQSAQWRKIGN